MINISDYCAELMKQTFTDANGKNYTPLAIMFFLKEHNFIIKDITFRELSNYIFRFYRDNPEFSKQNSNVFISNIEHYQCTDIQSYVREELSKWIEHGSGVLLYFDEKVFTNPKLKVSDDEIFLLNKTIELLCVKNYKQKIEYSSNVDDFYNLIGVESVENLPYKLYVEAISSSKLKNRAFEDINYCICCEATKCDEMQAIHINFNQDLNDIKNMFVLCKLHAELYYKGYFKFSKTGRIIIMKCHDSLDSRIHLPISFVKKKFKYL